MNGLTRPALSSLGSKYLMALTGLALIGFVLAHMAGNLLIFAGKEALNGYAKHLEELGLLLWVARRGLLAVFVLHIALGVRLWLSNRSARPVRYHYEDTVKASWASRHMLLTGLVILAFVIYHLLHFTFGVTDPAGFKHNVARYHVPADPVANGEYDVAAMVVHGFRQWPVSLGYLAAMVVLGIHLWHGGSSWLQSLGLNRKRSAWLVGLVGQVLALVVVVGNCSIPIAILCGFEPR
jgi:succinate dehydrogenase / fumarate reductase cytochrome b subunit